MTGVDLRREAKEQLIDGHVHDGSTLVVAELQKLQQLLTGASREQSTLSAAEVRAALGQSARDAGKFLNNDLEI